jgi:hypothetical protein
VKSNAFDSIGKTLNEDLEEESKSHGIGFRKKAGSKRAREARALAAEQRIQAIVSTSNLPIPPIVEDDPESEDEERDPETDYDRRRTLLEVIKEEDLDALRVTMLDPAQDFLSPSVGSSGECGYTCGVEDSALFGRIKTSPSAETYVETRPSKKRKISQSKLVFTPHSTSTAIEAAKAKREDAWDCIVCTL